MNQKDDIKELFAQKLKHQEAPVNPELWNAISSKMAATSAVSSSGLSIGMKVLISTLSVAGVVTLGFIFVKQSTSENTQNEQAVQKSIEKPTDAWQVPENETANGVEENTAGSIADGTYKQTKAVNQRKNDRVVSEGHPSSYNKGVHIFENVGSENEDGQIENKQGEQKDASQPVRAYQTENKEAEVNNPNVTPAKGSNIQEETTGVSPKEEDLYKVLPNVFTPNSDGENDYFWLKTKGLQDFSITVLNDKNQVVYSSSDPEFKWDGKDLSNKLVPQGNYIYYFTAKTVKGDSISKFSKLEIRY